MPDPKSAAPWQKFLILSYADHQKHMSSLALNIVYASLAIAGLIGLTCLVDLVAGVPFGGQSTFDILFLISAGITAYLGVDCIRNSA